MALNVSSLRFDNAVKYARLGTTGAPPTIKNLGNFTWMAWVQPNTELNKTLSQRAYVERQGTGTNIRFAAVPSKDRLRFELGVVDGDNDTNYDFVYNWDDYWHHIAFIGKVDGATPTYEMYLDGTKVADGSLRKSGPTTQKISNTNPINNVTYVGCASYNKSTDPEIFYEDRQWFGRIDDIVVYNNAKSQTDIQAYLANRNSLSVGDVDMISYWPFDENTGTLTTDLDTTANKGTLYYSGGSGSTLWTTDRPYIGHVSIGSVGPLDTTAPATVTFPATAIDNISTDGFTVHWNKTTDDVNVQKYEVRVSTFNNFSVQTITSVSAVHSSAATFAVDISDLLPNQIYYVKVIAMDAKNNISSDSAIKSATTTNTGDTTAPDPPAGIQAGSITYSSFVITITPDLTPEVPTGYKIDVATDKGFSKYVTGWRNHDNGNVLTATILGLKELTPYYFRARAYDAYGNESISSPVGIVATNARPDQTPPDPLDADAATSVDGRRFTANWSKGSDNIGVTGYYLDVSISNTFSSFLTGFNNLNVGNVLKYSVTGLTENTTYYYRVRPYDAAGNIANNGSSFATVTTRPLSLEDGDETQIVVTPSDTAYTYSGAPTVVQSIPNNPWKLTIHSASGTPSYRAYFQFTVPAEAVNLTSVILYVYINNSSTGATGLFRVGTGSFDSSTITWNTQPTPSNGPFSFTHGAVNTFQQIDVTPYVTGPGTYIISLETTSNDDAIYWSSRYPDPALQPRVEIEYSLSSLTRIDAAYPSNYVTNLTNYCTNPNFEANVTTGWSTSVGSLSVDATNGVAGSKALKGTYASSAVNPTISFASIAVTANQKITVHFSAFATLTAVGYSVIGTFTGTTGTRTDTIRMTGSMEEHIHTWQAGNAAGTFVFSIQYPTTASTNSVYVDNVCITKTSGSMGYFDGNSSGGLWSGTTNLSASTKDFYLPKLDVGYLGDSNNNNSAVAFIRKDFETSWFSVPTQATSISRTTNTITTNYPIVFPNINLVKNPSFEINTNGWITQGVTSLARDETYSKYGTACGLITFSGANASNGAYSDVMFGVEAGDSVYTSCYVMTPNNTDQPSVRIRFFTAAGALISESTPILGQSYQAGLGLGNWLFLWDIVTAPATAKQVQVVVKNLLTAQTNSIYVDGVMLGVGTKVPHYRDGTYSDAYFAGTAHLSPTFLKIMPNITYSLMDEITDPEGMLDGSGLTGQVSVNLLTSPVPTLQTIVSHITLTPSAYSVLVEVPYQGDDNNSMAALVYFKRSDQSTYSLASSYIDRNTKTIVGNLTDLTAGTAYNVRVDLIDSNGTSNTLNDSVYGIVTTLLDGVLPETTSLIMFGGFVLSDETARDNKVMVTSHDAFGFPERRIDSEDIPRQDGGVETQSYWGSRTIRMEGIVEGADRGDLANALDVFKRAMTPRLQPLIINSMANLGRKYNATVKSLNIDEKGGENFRHVRWSADFFCADPFAYSVNPYVYGPITVTSNTPININSSGGFDTFPVITLTTTSTSRVYIDITNITTGERITPEKGILADDVLIINSVEASVNMNGKEIGYSGIFPRLYAGANQLQFTFSGGPVQVTVKWTDRFL